MASRKQAQAPPQAPAQQHAYVPQTQPARSYFAAGPQVSHPIPGAVQGPAYYHPSPAAHHGQYIPSNAHNTPYPYSQSLPAHYPQRAAPPQRHTTPLTAPLLEDALLRVLEGSIEPLLSGQQERSSAAFAELASALSDIGRTFADEQVQMRAQVEALTKTVEHGQRIQLQATQAVFHRVGRLEKLVGVDGAIGEESDKSVWERLESIECDLGELLEKVKDPEAMLSPREPSPVRHEIATSPIPEQRKVYSNAGIGPQTPRREPEKVYANAGVSPRPSLTTSYLRGSLVGSLPASGSCLQIPAASIPPVRASSSASALAALQDIARMSARRKLLKPSAAFSGGDAPEPLTAADWSGAQTEPATSSCRRVFRSIFSRPPA
ncbi:hypothetical protein BV25DRAFT_309154 [Artomyces pyxidatus]|uniref:Uncharacterized protein n=1 Tax=Artomyces pyxidatus TaxID=48021 RepID=A0ACB8T8Q4_9AGAM|nr:hypothetical protein BV25DRAFT_309154 [Artomyces pyxidatus]